MGDDLPASRASTRRIAPLSVADVSERTAEVLATTNAMGGDHVLNIFTTLAHHPRALRHGVALGGAFLFAGNMDERVREIVILRVSRNTRSEYEYAQHVVIGQRCGMTADECVEVLRPAPAATFSEFERQVIAAVDELCTDDCVTDASWANLAAVWDDREMVEFAMLAGYYRMIAGFLNSAGVEIDPGLAGFPIG